MPLHLLNSLTAKQRSQRSNRQLGCLLAFVAGAVNAGGFLAVQKYTSHMTGIISAMADDLIMFKAIGYATVLPIAAAMLMAISVLPLFTDARIFLLRAVKR